MGAGRGGRDLLAQYHAHREFRGVHRARHPAARCLADQRGENRVFAQEIGHGHRVGVQVEQPPAAADRDGEIAQVGHGQLAGYVLRSRPERHDAPPVRQAQGAPVRPVPPLLNPRNRGRREVAEQVVRDQRQPEGEPQRQCPWRGGRVPAARTLAQLSRGEGEDLAHRVVERPDAGEARREGDIAHRQRAGLDQEPGGLGPLRPGHGERASSQLGEQLALDLADAVAEPGGEAGHAIAIDDPVGDQSHRPGH